MAFKRSAIGAAYASQGRAVKKVARQQRREARAPVRAARAQERYYQSQGQAVKAVAHVQRRRGIGLPSGGPGLTTYKEAQAAGNRAQAKRIMATRERRADKRQAVRREIRQQDRQVRRQIARQVQRTARAQERYYKSQGQMVKSVAAAPLRRPEPEKKKGLDIGGIAVKQLGSFVPALPLLKDVAERAGVLRKATAPSAKALEQTMRPTWAVMNAAKHDVKQFQKHGPAGLIGHGSLKAAAKGITGKEKTTGSDVLAQAGVHNKLVKSVGGFALDVGLDPTTYISLGTAPAARQAAVRAAMAAAKDAAKAGATRAERKQIFLSTQRRAMAGHASTVGQRAGKQAAAKAKKAGATKSEQRSAHESANRQARAKAQGGDKGIEVRFAGKRVPGVTRATAPVGRAARELAAPLTRNRAAQQTRQATRNVAASLHGNVRKATVAKGEEDLVKGVKRETRAEQEKLTRRATERGNSMVGAIAEGEGRQVIDAIEARALHRLADAPKRRVPKARVLGVKVPKLGQAAKRGKALRDPKRLSKSAETVRSELRYQHRQGQRAGVIRGTVGARGRTRAEAVLSSRGGVTVPVARYEKAVETAQADLKQAVTAMREAKGAARPAARERLTDAGARVERSKRQLASAQRSQRIAGAAKHGERTLKRRRLATEAEDYYPRIDVADTEKRGILERIGAAKADDVPRGKEQIGVAKPKPNAAHQRELKGSRAQLEAEGRNVTQRWSENPVRDIAKAGTSNAKAVAAGNLNRKIVQEVGKKVPKNLTKAQLAALEKEGTHLYRVRGGDLEEMAADDLSADAIAKIAGGPGAGKSAGEKGASPIFKGGGQYALVPKRLVTEVRDAQALPMADLPAVQAFDAAQGAFKGLALATPGYLTRNLAGDLWNANLYEGNKVNLAKNLFKGGRALNALGKYEKGLRQFGASIPKDKRVIKLSDEQAEAFRQAGHEIGPDNKINALQVALAAERAGAVRQGRFLELMEESRSLDRPNTSRLWQNATKRVEDSVRIGTFLGAIGRGELPREAAKTSSKFHFDYGDLTSFEKGVLRRLMPFYTFSSRNIPLQAEMLVRKPGRFATLEKAREEGRKAQGLPRGYEEGLDPFEARQLGIPIPLPGGKTGTISMGGPFTDLNDIVSTAAGSWKAPFNRSLEMLGPWKTPIELAQNVSFFYRDQIAPDQAPETIAPEWAVKLAKAGPAGKAWAKANGLRDDYLDQQTGNQTWGWSKKNDYFWRQASVGPIGLVLKAPGLGVKGLNARDQGPVESLVNSSGVRVKEYKPANAERSKIWKQLDDITARKTKLGDSAHPTARRPNGKPYLINDDHPTKEYTRLQKQEGKLRSRLVVLDKTIKPQGFSSGRPIGQGSTSKKKKDPLADLKSSSGSDGLYLDDLKSPKGKQLYLDDLK